MDCLIDHGVMIHSLIHDEINGLMMFLLDAFIDGVMTCLLE